MNNLYQALNTFMKEADAAYQSHNHPELNEAFDHLNALYERLSDEVDQTTTAPTKLVLITYQSFKEEAVPYSIEALEFVAAHHDCIDSIRIVELRNL